MISYYHKISGGPGATKSTASMPIEQFFAEVKDGEYKGIVEAIREAKTEEKQKELKKNAPAVTPSGIFSHRSGRGLLRHSGVVCIDIDQDQQGEGFDVDKAFEAIIKDENLYAAHKSIRGKGLALYFKMEQRGLTASKDHAKAYDHITAYLFKKYGLICDKTSDVPRLRFVSYDPDLYLNKEAPQWSDYTHSPDRRRGRPKKNSGNDIPSLEEMRGLCQKLAEKNPNLLDDYVDWQKAAFILADSYEEEGRGIFHILSERSEKYDDTACDRKYDNALKTSKGEGASIATLLFWAKETGMELPTKTKSKLRGKRDEDGDEEGSPKRLKGEEKLKDDLKKLEKLVEKYNFRYNSMTGIEECDYEPDNQSLYPNVVTDAKINKLLLEARKEIRPSLPASQLIETISAKAEIYDPVKNFLEENKDYKRGGQIQEVLDCIELFETDQEEITKTFIRKWMIGILGMYHGQVNELFLIMAGAPRTGKTSFFRNLLPEELSAFYSEGDHALDKDEQLKMTSNLLLINDEMTDSHKADWAARKKACSLSEVKVRPAYARKQVILRRRATFGGSTNDHHFLSDVTGNRRFLPVNLKMLQYDKFMAIDKKALFLELNDEVLKDRNSMYLDYKEIKSLEESFHTNKQSWAEEELIPKYFEPGVLGEKDVFKVTNTELRTILREVSPENINAKRLGMVLKRLGYEQENSSTRNYIIKDLKGLITRHNI